MIPIREADTAELYWVHPHLMKRQYELYGGSELLATLRWENLLGSLATAAAADGSWTFQRASFFQKHVVARLAASGEEVAQLKRNPGGSGVLLFNDARQYKWANTSFWRNEWVWRTNKDIPLIYFKKAKELELSPLALSQPVLSLLAVLGWYLLKLQQEEARAFRG